MENGNETASMTGDQLTQELYLRQGYLIMQALRPEPIGHIAASPKTFLGDSQYPMRIVAEATRADFLMQNQLAMAITGFVPTSQPDYWPTEYYYRVEAAD